MVATVIAFGSFDILHPGHLGYLKQASRLGKRLVVVVSRDSSIRMIKHREPVFRENDRLAIVSSLDFVDVAVLGNKLKKKADAFSILKSYRPNVIALGYDQKVNVKDLKRWLSKNKMKAKVVRIPPFKKGVNKSSKIAKSLGL